MSTRKKLVLLLALAAVVVTGAGFRALLVLGVGRLAQHLVPLQQRVALQLGLDEHTKLKIGKLQKANGLLQLGGHHQLLALP